VVGTLRTYRTTLEETHSSLDRIGLDWLRSLLALIVLHWLFIVSRGTLGLLGVGPATLTALLDLFSITIFLVFTTVLVVRGLGQVKVFAGVEGAARATDSTLSEAELGAAVARLNEFVQTRRPHLNPALTLDELAAGLAIPAWRLSQVINRAFGQNFCTFVNGHRVEEAKSRLIDPAGRGKTILEILYDSGFNSKSAFHDAFKKRTGLTPTQYRKRFADPGVHAA
jgi:AraC-like DNA-binding protein